MRVFTYGQFVLWLALCFFVYFLLLVLSLFVSTSATECLERLVSETSYYVSNGT